jgi:TolA-binding protein
MRRGVLAFALCVAGVFYGWRWVVTESGFSRYLDENPETWKADFFLYSLASYHELFNNNEQALALYRKVVDRYPESRHADDCQFGVAGSQERLKRRAEAVREYKIYMEKFPDGKRAKSVRRNLEILGF